MISIHIPKTAGRSFQAILEQVYGQEKVCSVTKKDLRKFRVSRKTEIDVNQIVPDGTRAFHGHFTVPEIAGLSQEFRLPIVTWVREPVERVISNYYFFIKRIRDGAKPWNEHRKHETLLEYAALTDNRNRMANFLDGMTLQELFFAGVMEYFSEDLTCLAQLLGWGIVDLPYLNSSQAFRNRFAPVDKEIKQKIRSFNDRDVKLYQEVLSLREKRFWSKNV
ncbi:MAG: sulfotransferase family protein [bacterium]|nr:sulfotransferase family protein [bacterium]